MAANKNNEIVLHCSVCREGLVRRMSTAGRKVAYLQIPDLELPADLELPTCEYCHSVSMAADRDAEVFDASVEAAFSKALLDKARASLAALVACGHKQRALEEVLGISPGYLSKLKAGKEISPLLGSCLLLLANDPSRVGELRNSWRMETSVTADQYTFYNLKPAASGFGQAWYHDTETFAAPETKVQAVVTWPSTRKVSA